MLRSLKMYGMAVVPEARLRRDAIIDLIEQGAPIGWSQTVSGTSPKPI